MLPSHPALRGIYLTAYAVAVALAASHAVVAFFMRDWLGFMALAFAYFWLVSVVPKDWRAS